MDYEKQTYWGGNGKYQTEYDYLYDTLVPPQDCAITLEGELLRQVSNLAYDYYNNGNCNMSLRETDYCYDCDGDGYVEMGYEIDGGDVVETCYECDGDGNVDGDWVLTERCQDILDLIKESIPYSKSLIDGARMSLMSSNYSYDHLGNKPYELLIDKVVEFVMNNKREVMTINPT
tara:strand:- start:35 stop:559 length:525 start_codon:yes stop_codon:yes gene_type:complete